MKRILLTDDEGEVWFGILRVFKPWVLNRAVLSMAIQADPFPDAGKLYQRCRRVEELEGIRRPPVTERGWTNDEVKDVADSLGLDVCNPDKAAK